MFHSLCVKVPQNTIDVPLTMYHGIKNYYLLPKNSNSDSISVYLAHS